MAVVLYAVSIQQAVASGDLRRMKALARQADRYVQTHGNVTTALALLKIEIAKIEGQRLRRTTE